MSCREYGQESYCHNFCFEIALGVDVGKDGRKYEYRMNYSQAIKTCRDFLRIHDRESGMDVEGLAASSIEAARPGRIFPRQKRSRLP